VKQIRPYNHFKISDECFDAFFSSNYASLCFFADRFLKDRQAAEDIVVEVATSIWKKRGTVRHTEALKNYFYVSIRNACIRFLQNKKRQANKKKELKGDYILQERTTLENIIHTEMLHQIEKALNDLPSKCRKVFIKLYIEGKTVSEAANELRLSLNTIKTHRKRGLKFLRDSISLIVLAGYLQTITI